MYRYTCVYNVKNIGRNKENEICLPNKELINGTDEKVLIWLPNAQYIYILLLS